MSIKAILIPILLFLIFASSFVYSGSLYQYNVDDEDGLDYVNDEVNGLANLVDRVDIRKVSIEVGSDYTELIILFNDKPLTNEEVVDSASNGSFVYRIQLEAGVSVNDMDGSIKFNLMSGLQYDDSKNEYVLATIAWYVYDLDGNLIYDGFGFYNVSGNELRYKSVLPSDIVLGPPLETNEYLNLTSYVNQQGKDLIIDTLSYKVDVEVNPRDFSENVTGGDADSDDAGTPDSSGEPSTEVEVPETPIDKEAADGFPLLFIGVALAVAVSMALFLLFKRRG